MTSPSIARMPMRMAVPRMIPERMARPVPVHGIARFVFWTLFLLTLTNAIGMAITYIRIVVDEKFQIGVYPVTFAVCAALIFTFTRHSPRSTLWRVSWVFWIVFFLFGFLGPEQLTGSFFRPVIEVTVKPWMAMIGLPWLAMRAISKDKLPRFLHATVLVSSVGATLGILQVAFPGFLADVSVGAGRATGFWLNPNTFGIMCDLALFISLSCPFRRRWLNWTTRLVLVAGVAFSFSRAAMLCLLVGWIVYGISSKRVGTLLKSLVGLVLFVASVLSVLEIIETVAPKQAERISLVRSFLEGNWSRYDSDNRSDIWKATFDMIKSKGGLIFGLGHGAGMYTVETGEGAVAPHNYYLYVLANSGIFALLALLVFHIALFQQAYKCKSREVRAALMAIATIVFLNHFFDHTFMSWSFTGAIMASVVLLACYDKLAPVVAPQHPRSLYRFQPIGPRRVKMAQP